MNMSPAEAIALANKIDSEGFEPADVDQVAEALRHMARLVNKAPIFFAPDADFDGDKLKWLQDAKLV